MADRSAYDILSMLGGQQQKNVELFSGLIDSGFKSATIGVKNASDILTQTVGSALDYKKTIVDEWYKTENLKQQDRQLEATVAYHNANLKLQERQINATEERYKAINNREMAQTALAEQNKNTRLFLTEKRHLFESSLRGLSTIGAQNKSTLASLQKSLTEQGHLWPASTVRETQNKITELQQRDVGLQDQLQNLMTDMGNLDGTINGLARGDIDSETALKELDYISPQIKEAGVESRPLGVRSTITTPEGQRPFGFSPSGGSGAIHTPNAPGESSFVPFVGDAIESEAYISNPPIDEDTEKHDLGMASGMINNLAENGGPQAVQKINNYINTRVNSAAKRVFDEQKTELEKRFFKDQFRNVLITDPKAAEQFKLDEGKFTVEYLKKGGDPRRLDEIKQSVMNEYQSIYETESASEKNKKIEDLFGRTFPSEAKKGIPTNSANQELQPKVIDPRTGKLNVPDEFEERPTTSFEKDIQSGNETERQIVLDVFGGINKKGERVHGYALTKDSDGKSKLSERAIKQIASAPLYKFIRAGFVSQLAPSHETGGYSDYSDLEHAGTKNLSEKDKVELNARKRKAVEFLTNPKNKMKAINFIIDLNKSV